MPDVNRLRGGVKDFCFGLWFYLYHNLGQSIMELRLCGRAGPHERASWYRAEVDFHFLVDRKLREGIQREARQDISPKHTFTVYFVQLGLVSYLLTPPSSTIKLHTYQGIRPESTGSKPLAVPSDTPRRGFANPSQ